MNMNYKKISNKSKLIATSVVLTTALTTSQVMAKEASVTRIGEADRYATAASVATTNWTNPKNVILVCGEGYADAVSASVLAKKLDAPILLTESKSLNKNTKSALEKLNPDNVYVIGGTASVSKEVRSDLKNNNYNLIELSGKNRYETNIAVANELVKLGVNAENVMLVSGEGFSDALSVAPVASAKGQILLLGNNNDKQPALDFVKDKKCKVTVVGTTYSINDSVCKALGNAKRVNGGANRFETNLNVLNEFKDDLNSDKLFIANSSGEGYADALVASALAGKTASYLVLVDTDESQATSKALDYIKGNKDKLKNLNVIGGNKVVSDNMISKINKLYGKDEDTSETPTIKSIESNGLNQIRIEFNTKVDEDSAESIGNYELDGSVLDESTQEKTVVSLDDDEKTVVITFSRPFNQSSTSTLNVRSGIYDKGLKHVIQGMDKKLTFYDITYPTLKSVKAVGGNKLVIKFSEPIRIKESDLDSIKINRQSVKDYDLSTSKTELYNNAGDWTDHIELYFDTALSIGENTLTIPEGEADKKFDNAAKFPIQRITQKFNVEEKEGIAKIENVYTENGDTVYIVFDRSMDKETALDDSNYKINDSTVSVSSDDITFKEDSDDKIVKIKDVDDMLESGKNKLTVISDVMDSYGNEIDETDFDFNFTEDKNRPSVSNVTLVDNDTMRVKFNKDVDSSSAENKNNYKITDSSGSNISYKIDNINRVDDKTYDINFEDNNCLSGEKYTITISNVEDENSDANIMYPYTKVITGYNDEETKVTEAVKGNSDENELVVLFSKAMKRDTIENLNNYSFVNGKGEYKKLPIGCSITSSEDLKNVIINFPSNYTVGSGDTPVSVKQIVVRDVLNKDGGKLYIPAQTIDISRSSSNGPELIDGTAKMYYENGAIKVRASLTSSLDIINKNDFEVEGETPDRAEIVGSDIILTFTSSKKIDEIKDGGDSASIRISGSRSIDTAGRSIKTSSDTVTIPPFTKQDEWKGSEKDDSITIVFDKDIDEDIESSYSDDFVFVNERTNAKLNVKSCEVHGEEVVYTFYDGDLKEGDKISVSANSNQQNINIRTDESSNGNYGKYVPSREDLNNKTITIK